MIVFGYVCPTRNGLAPCEQYGTLLLGLKHHWACLPVRVSFELSVVALHDQACDRHRCPVSKTITGKALRRPVMAPTAAQHAHVDLGCFQTGWAITKFRQICASSASGMDDIVYWISEPPLLSNFAVALLVAKKGTCPRTLLFPRGG